MVGARGGWGAVRGGLVARLQLHETVGYMARVTCVTVAAELDGELLLSDRCIHFVPEDTPMLLPRKDRYERRFSLNDLKKFSS